MFPPGFFAADYFAPGYWPDASEATASDSMAATLSGVAQLVATGATTQRQVTQAPDFGGGRFAIQRRVLPRSVPLFAPIYADMASVSRGNSSISARISANHAGAARMAGGAEVSGAMIAQVNFTKRDNAFWLLAA